jgi:hypothetical protein
MTTPTPGLAPTMREAAEASTPDDTGPGPFSRLVDQEWQTLLDKDDRTSPEEHPEMCLLTRTELAWAMMEAWLLGKETSPALTSPLDPDTASLIAELRSRGVTLPFRGSVVTQWEPDELCLRAADALEALSRISTKARRADEALAEFRAAALDAFVVNFSEGSPDPAKRAAGVNFRFEGEGASKRSHRLYDALGALASLSEPVDPPNQALGGQTQGGATDSGKPSGGDPADEGRIGRAVIGAATLDSANAPPADMVKVLGLAALDALWGPITPGLDAELKAELWPAPASNHPTTDALVERERIAEAVHLGRFPADRDPTPWADECRTGRDYCYRIADAILARLSPVSAEEGE